MSNKPWIFKLTIACFVLVITFSARAQSQDEARSKSESQLSAFDSNSDGKLTREEFPERLRRLFDRIDANSDGFVTVEEEFAYRERDASNRPADAWVEEVSEDQLDGRLYVEFHSEVIGQDYCFSIYLPPSYNEQPNRRYPVVYWLHGIRGGVLRGGQFYKHYRAALEAKQAPELILVFPKARHGSFYCDSVDGEKPVESVIMKDLIPYVDSHYRTAAGREGRAVEGESMGGFGAFHLAFKYPDMFCGSTSLIGAFVGAEPSEEDRAGTQDSMFGGDFDLFHAESPSALIRKNREAIRGKMEIRIFDGDEDFFYPHNEGMHDLLRDLEVAHSYTVLAGVGHNGPAIYKRMGPPMFAFYGELFADLLKE